MMEEQKIPEGYVSIQQLIDDHFIKDKDVHEVVRYVMACLTIDDQVTIARITNAKEVSGISPESYYLMKAYDNGLTTNKFWIENYAPIKLQIALSNIKQETSIKYLDFSLRGDVEDDGSVENALKASRAIIMTRLDALTLIAFLWKGPAYAQDFDARFRLVFQLADVTEKFYSEKGI